MGTAPGVALLKDWDAEPVPAATADPRAYPTTPSEGTGTTGATGPSGGSPG